MNRITNVTMPESVRAGEEFDVTVDYTADNDGDLKIACRGTFAGRPDDEPLAAAQTRKTFPMTIVRYGTDHQCRVEFRFGNLWVSLVEVT